jgi:carbamoyl-phosphate synthase small subunit
MTTGAPGPHSILALEDGKVFYGYNFGARVDTEGELCFNTSMTGYEEISTDPSYRGQLVTLTYPLINNYGVTPLDMESGRPWLAGLVVRELCTHPSNWRADSSLAAFFERHGVPGLCGVDTRAITRHLRDHGFKRAVMALVPPSELPSEAHDPFLWLTGRIPALHDYVEHLIGKARAVTPLSLQPVVPEVSYHRGLFQLDAPWQPWPQPPQIAKGKRIVLIDTGAKHNIARSLVARGAEVIFVPYGVTYEEVRDLSPAGVLICNGPGDPDAEVMRQTVATTKQLTQKYPVMGICLGHQILGLAAGARTSRLKFGHRGANHPVRDLRTGHVYITTQNHGFQVDADSIPASSGFQVSQVSLNDGSVEGLAHKDLPVFSVQYHPEACPGPQDNQYLFNQFLESLA